MGSLRILGTQHFSDGLFLAPTFKPLTETMFTTYQFLVNTIKLGMCL